MRAAHSLLKKIQKSLPNKISFFPPFFLPHRSSKRGLMMAHTPEKREGALKIKILRVLSGYLAWPTENSWPDHEKKKNRQQTSKKKETEKEVGLVHRK